MAVDGGALGTTRALLVTAAPDTAVALGLRAPLVLGGVALGLDALHELAPYAVQAMGALPRWLPPAPAGLLLLGVGATYEQRLRDARRLRRGFARMRRPRGTGRTTGPRRPVGRSSGPRSGWAILGSNQ
ncbi:SCO7613 C-terminal domain-containing membrane protein [Streptomyces sp. NPDC087658]|uniref:SCO7613 C-terminal domain-containing membrane protein n=1 Tax=Streptomyces sp. NPDC087658 TaxID=3365800 RepID=UPI003805BC05